MTTAMKKMVRQEYAIIIGCGRLGASIANSLSDEGGNVLVIDSDKDAFRKLSPSFGGLTLTGDATDMDILHEAQIEKAAIVIAATDNDNANIMVAQLAKVHFQVPCVIIRLYDPDREWVCREMDIHMICPAVLSAKEIGKLLADMQEEAAE